MKKKGIQKRKKHKLYITTRQKLACKRLAEKGGSVGKAMREAGYTEKTAKTPKKLTESRGWKALMEKHLSDEVLSKAHKELLNSQAIQKLTFPKGIKIKNINKIFKDSNISILKMQLCGDLRFVYFCSVDNNARSKGLDMGYKLKGRYAAEKVKFIDPYEDMSDEELDEKIEELESQKND